MYYRWTSSRRSVTWMRENTNPRQDLGGVQCPDAAELGQGAPRRIDSRLNVARWFGDATVECADLSDEVHGQPRGLTADRAADILPDPDQFLMGQLSLRVPSRSAASPQAGETRAHTKTSVTP
jgi:hypothetical protein